MFGSAKIIAADVAEIVKPRPRVTVAQAAEELVWISARHGKWRNSRAPYLVEPMECLTSRELDSLIFAGVAQSGKTQAFADNWLAYTIIYDPVDMMIVNSVELNAADFSKRRVNRMVNRSPALAAQKIPGHADSVFEKRYASGIIVSLRWPTKNHLSGKPISRMVLVDYDRMASDVDGEGSPFVLAWQRTKTFGRRGMVVAESSPSRPIVDPKWKRKTPHEAPPTTGILGLYNQGDRRRLYGKCPHCGSRFSPEASIDAIHIPDGNSNEQKAKKAKLICTASGCEIDQEYEMDFKMSGIWLKDGQIFENEKIVGAPEFSSRASFWLSGWMAAYSSWGSIALNYLRASANEDDLRAVINTEIGGIYVNEAQRLAGEWNPESLQRMEVRATAIKKGVVPREVACILACVDVQGNRFEVAVWGHGNAQRWLVDRFAIYEHEGQRISPNTHVEHWQPLKSDLLDRRFETEDGFEMQVHALVIDSGGEAGVSERANAFVASFKGRPDWKRVYLGKGSGLFNKKATSRNAPIVKKTWPDAAKVSGRGGRVGVPLLMFNSDKAKDAVFADLNRKQPGPGFIHFPQWTPDYVYKELTAETRTANGWENLGRKRNETFDLLYYDECLWRHLKGDMIDWSKPPKWAGKRLLNPDVFNKEPKTVEAPPKKPRKKTKIGPARRN